jgi:hypothetical protein
MGRELAIGAGRQLGEEHLVAAVSESRRLSETDPEAVAEITHWLDATRHRGVIHARSRYGPVKRRRGDRFGWNSEVPAQHMRMRHEVQLGDNLT